MTVGKRWNDKLAVLYRPLGYERAYLPPFKVADTPFISKETNIYIISRGNTFADETTCNSFILYRFFIVFFIVFIVNNSSIYLLATKQYV